MKNSNRLYSLQNSPLIICSNNKNNLSVSSENKTECYINSVKNKLFNESLNITDTLCEVNFNINYKNKNNFKFNLRHHRMLKYLWRKNKLS